MSPTMSRLRLGSRFGSRWVFCLIAGTIALTACDRLTTDRPNADLPPEVTPVPPPIAPNSTSVPAEPAPATSPQSPTAPDPDPDPYEEAIAKASSAVRLSQSAAAPADWQLVVDRWQAAITWLNQVPATHPQHAQVAAKLADYQRQRTQAQQQAQQQAQRSRNVPTGGSPPQAPTVALRPNAQGTFVPVTPPGRTQVSAATTPDAAATESPTRFQTPIKRREGRTPVIDVLFNGRYQFEMIVDTGASGTVITQDMARMLGVVPQQTARVNTATEANVQMPVGMVDSIAVGGRVIQQVPVAIASPALAIGLLGQDFFHDYDLIIRESVVEFHARNS